MVKNKKIICWIITIIAAVILWFFYNWGGNLLRPLAIRKIKEMTGARVDIDSVKFKFSGKVSLGNIQIRPLLKTTPDNAILTAKNLDAYFSPISILRFKPRLKRLKIEDFTLNAQYNNDTKLWNITALKLATDKSGDLPPQLRFKRGKVKFTQINDAKEVETIACYIRSGTAITEYKDDLYTLIIKEDYATETTGDRIIVKWTKDEKSRVQVEGFLPKLDLNLFGSKCTLNSFNSKIAADKNNIIFENTNIAIGPQTVIDVNGIIKNLKKDPSFVFGVKIKDLTARSGPAENCFAYGSRIFENFIPLLQVFFDYFNPQGLLDLDVVLTGKVSQIAKTQCKGYLDCKDISIKYFQFPYLVEHMAGKIDVTETSMTMKDIKAVHGQVDITMNGYCGGFGETMDCNVVLSSNNMLLDDDLYAALLEHHKKLWYIFSPAGVVSGDFVYTAKPPDTRKMQLYADLLNVSIMCQYFPYSVQDITGKIAVDSDTIELKDLVSRRDSGTIKMYGKITQANTPKPVYDFQIQADDVAIDSQLINAFPKEQKEFFSNFEIQAKGDADIDIHSVDNNEMPIDYLARLNIKGDLIKHPLLPEPLTNITLDANLTPATLDIKSFKADFNNSPIDAAGTIWTSSGKEAMGYCMRLKALNFTLDSNTVKPVLGPGSAKLLEDFQFNGAVNLEAVLGKNSRIKCPPYEIAVDCLSDTAVISKLNLPLKDITGRIIVKPENIEFVSLSATPANSIQLETPSRIKLDGKIKMTEDALDTAELKLTATDMSFDESLAAMMGKIGKYYTKLEPTGRFDLNFDKIKLYKDDAGDKAVHFDGNLAFKNCSIGKKKQISNIYALLDIDARYKIGTGLQKCRMFLNTQNVSVKDRPFEKLKVPIIIDVNEHKIIVENFIGDFLGGKVTGTAEFETDNDGKFSNYKIDMALSRVSTERFVSPQATNKPDSSGKVYGELNIHGDFKNPQVTRGRLIAEITGLKPKQTGILAQLQTAIYEAVKKELAFDNIKVLAVVKGKTVQISRFDMYGPTASLRGSGTYKPDSDLVDIKFTGHSAAGKDEPGFIESLTAGFGAAFLRVEVKGKLESPEIKVIPMPIFQKSLEIIGTK